MNEAKNMAKFNGDKNIVNVFDFFKENNTAYIVMEYLEGETLKVYMAECGCLLSSEEACSIISDLLDAVKTIHLKGIIHRDISPDNIFILKDKRVKLLDFGAARFSADEDTEVTQSAVIKMGYAPIEQYRSNMKQGVWTDIYALGATLYKMVTGVTPEESVDRVEKDCLKRPGRLALVDSHTEKVIMKAMAIKPEMRFKSVDQFKQALFSKTGVDFPEVELRKRKRQRNFIVIASVLVFLIMGSYVGYQSTRPVENTLAAIEIQEGTIYVALPNVTDQAEIYTRLINQFCEEYPQYKVEITEGEKAVLAPVEQIENRADLAILLNSIDSEKFVFSSENIDAFTKERYLPLGFDFQVVYADLIGFEDAGQEIPNRIDSKTEVEEIIQLVGENNIILSWGSELRNIQSKWPGYYGVIAYYNENRLPITYTQKWAISADVSEEQQMAGMLLLHFFMSEYSQNTFFIQNDNGMPVNKNTFAEYLEINPDFENLEKDIKKTIVVE